MSRYALVINDKAGSGNGNDAVACMRERYGPFILLDLASAEPGALEALVADPEVEKLAVCGGDGSVSAVLSALGDRELPVAIVPGGTANLLAHELELPFEPRRACELFGGGRVTRVDALEVDAPNVDVRRCLCRLALGDFASSGQRSRPDDKQAAGSLAYLFNGLPEITTPNARRFSVTIDDGPPRSIEASSLVLTNIARVGLGNMRWGSEVSARDGVAELIALRPESLSDTAALTADAVWNEPMASSYTEHWPVRTQATFFDLGGVPVVVDGEPLEVDQLRVRLVPGGVAVLVP